jgi:hypothetical protein
MFKDAKNKCLNLLNLSGGFITQWLTTSHSREMYQTVKTTFRTNGGGTSSGILKEMFHAIFLYNLAGHFLEGYFDYLKLGLLEYSEKSLVSYPLKL